jgi:hypothetical protein
MRTGNNIRKIQFERKMTETGMFNYDLFANLPKYQRPWYKRLIRRLNWILRGLV